MKNKRNKLGKAQFLKFRSKQKLQAKNARVNRSSEL
jgi:hypothetical protein